MDMMVKICDHILSRLAALQWMNNALMRSSAVIYGLHWLVR